MEYGTIQGIDKPVARIVLGTMILTDQPHVRTEECPDLGREGSLEYLDAVFALGCNAFDTAHGYGIPSGASERGLGLWMKLRGNRDQVVVITKGGIRRSPPAEYRAMPSFIEADIYESLARLQTSYIDLYLMHYDDDRHPVGPFVEMLDKHRRLGNIRAYGGSNWSHRRLAEANEYAARHGLAPFVASEPNYCLAVQAVPQFGPGCVSISGPANKEAREWYIATQMPVISYSSLGSGFFSGSVTRDDFGKVRHTMGEDSVRAYCHEDNFQRLERAAALGKEKGATAAQVALAFIMQSGLNVFPLTGAQTVKEVEENVRALEIKLTPQERAWLDLESDER